MSKDKIANNIMWSVSAVAGFLIAERIYDVAMRVVNRGKQSNDILEEESE